MKNQVRMAKNRSGARRAILAAIIATTIAGCGGGGKAEKHVAISGAVTLDGQPLKQGTITIHPDAIVRPGGKTESGMSASTAIKDGRFAFTEDDGPPPGPGQVDVIAQRELSFPIDDEAAFAEAAKKGGKPLSPTIANITFKDPEKKKVTIPETGGTFQFEVVSPRAKGPEVKPTAVEQP